MSIIKRLSDSMFSPKEVYKYKDDKWWNVILMFLLLLLIFIIPSTLSIALKNSISYEEKNEIKKIFANETIPFQIRNGVLLNENADDEFVYNKELSAGLFLMITNNPEPDFDYNTNLVILLSNDGVYFQTKVFKIKIFSYDQYEELDDVDLSELSSIKSSNWDNIFTVINSEYKHFYKTLRPILIIINIISAAGALLIMSLMITLLQYFILKNQIGFRTLWKLCLYLFTPYVVIETVLALFGLSIMHIGFIVTAIYIIILSRTIQSQNIRGKF